MPNFLYIGKTFLNCANDGQKSALDADQAFGKTLRESYNTFFSEAQGIFKNLNASLNSVIAAGSSQQGESSQELAAKNSQALNSAASANKQIQQSIGDKAAMTGATPGVESGVVTGARANAEAAVENNLSNQQADITKENYAIGRSKYDLAVKEQMALPGAIMDPVNASANPANTANEVTGKAANDLQASSSSWMGLVGGLADSAVGGLTGGVGGKLGGKLGGMFGKKGT